MQSLFQVCKGSEITQQMLEPHLNLYGPASGISAGALMSTVHPTVRPHDQMACDVQAAPDLDKDPRPTCRGRN